MMLYGEGETVDNNCVSCSVSLTYKTKSKIYVSLFYPPNVTSFIVTSL
jgi:hypothetical protein